MRWSCLHKPPSFNGLLPYLPHKRETSATMGCFSLFRRSTDTVLRADLKHYSTSPKQSFLVCFLDLWHEHVVKGGMDLFLSADHLTAWTSLELQEYLFPMFWLKEKITVGDLARHWKSATEVQSLESKRLYYRRCSSYLDTFLKQHILDCCKSSER